MASSCQGTGGGLGPSPVFRSSFSALTPFAFMEGATVTSGYRLLQGHTKVEDERGYHLISFRPSCTQHDAGLKLAGRN
jgi:hypothetical protein